MSQLPGLRRHRSRLTALVNGAEYGELPLAVQCTVCNSRRVTLLVGCELIELPPGPYEPVRTLAVEIFCGGCGTTALAHREDLFPAELSQPELESLIPC